ncbi:MAG: GAF domain-containing protein, partial [Longimicrobiales bacterium]
MTQRSSAPVGSPAAVTPARVLLSVLSVAAMLVLTMLVRQWAPYAQMTLFLVAVLVAASMGGFGLGVFAVVLSVIAVELALYPPVGIAASELLSGRIVPWVVVALVASYVVGRLRRDRVRTAAEQAEAVRRVADRAERLQLFNAQMLDRVGAAGVANVIVNQGRRAMEAKGAAVVIARENEAPDVVAAHGYTDDVLNPASDLYRGPTPLMDAIEHGEPIWLEDEAVLHARYPGMSAYPKQGRAWAALPLRLDGRRIGALALSYERAGPFTAEDRSFMLLIAQQCAQALERARLHDME